MSRPTRLASCALAVLLVSSAMAPQAPADQYYDLWDLIGTQPVPVRGPVHYENFGIVLRVTPVVKDRNARSEVMFVLLDDTILFNVGDSRKPCWEPISDREF